MDNNGNVTLCSLPDRPLSAQLRESAARVVEWRPWPFDNPSLIGHCAVAFAGGWVMHGIPMFRTKDGSLSVGVPNAAQLDAEGRIKQRDGKRDYKSIVSFETTEGRERWQRLVLAALADAGVGGAA
jgi:hypothetical protein